MRKIITSALVALLTLSVSTVAVADPIRDRQYWLNDFGFTKAWQLSRGEGVRVAVIDTGIDASHPSLEGVVVGGIDVSGLGSSDGLTPGVKTATTAQWWLRYWLDEETPKMNRQEFWELRRRCSYFLSRWPLVLKG